MTSGAVPRTETSLTDTDELRRSVELMAKIGTCYGASFSPDGRRIAFLSDLSGLPQVWIVSRDGGWPDKVTAFDDPVGNVSWSPDGAWLALSVAPGGGMNTQVYLIRPDGTGLRLLTDGGTDNNWLGPWTRDGRFLALSSNRERDESMDCYLADIRTGQMRLIARNAGTGRVEDLSPDAKWATIQRVVHRSDANLFLVNLQSGEEALLTPHVGPASVYGGEFSPDGRTLYLASNQDRDLTAFARISIDRTGKPGPIEVLAERDGAELDGFQLTDDGRTAALLWNLAGRNELAFLDLASLHLRLGPEMPREVGVIHHYSQDGRFLPLSICGAAAPWDVWVVDVDSGRFFQVTHSPHPGVNLNALVQPEFVRFPAHDGLGLSGWLYRPPQATSPGPTVLNFHGGPEGQERPSFSDDYQALLAHGIAVLAPNVRGSAGFGKAFVNLDNGAFRFDAIKDIKACVDYVVGVGIADPKRVGIMGGSYGGYMTMVGLTEYADLLAAGVNLFGVVNFETFFQQTEPWMAAISKIEYGDPETDVNLLRRLSPIHRIDRVQAPTLVLHGANDTNVPVVEAEQVVDCLRERGVPVKYVLFPDEGHGFVKTANRIRATVEIVTWFTKYL